MADIFRKEALERLSSPERLDQLMQVVGPKDWLALTVFAALMALALLWSVFGRLPTMVMGRGVLIRPRKVVDMQAPASGRVVELAVQVGDRIKTGDVLGTIDQAETRQLLEKERLKLQELLAQDEAKSTLEAQQTALQVQQSKLEARAIQLQRQDLQKQLGDAEAKAPLLQQRVERRRQLEAMGLMPKISDERLQAEQAYLENQDKIAAFQAKLKQLESQLKQLESREKHLVLQNLEVSTARKNAIQELQSRIALYEGQLARHSQIVSKHDGRILELTVNAGQMVEIGRRLGSIQVEDLASTLVGLTYFPIKAGKKIEPGMTIQIAPDTVERERFGTILGTVTSVSAFPVTKEGAASLVGNVEVVEALVTRGPVIEVVAKLTQDPSVFSGYKWSSSVGPRLRMTSGTTMTGRVVIEQRAPITYLLPFLREISGFY